MLFQFLTWEADNAEKFDSRRFLNYLDYINEILYVLK